MNPGDLVKTNRAAFQAYGNISIWAKPSVEVDFRSRLEDPRLPSLAHDYVCELLDVALVIMTLEYDVLLTTGDHVGWVRKDYLCVVNADA